MLEFQKVVKLKEQVVSGIVYYITLEATQGSENEEDYQNYYEAKIWLKIHGWTLRSCWILSI